MDPATPASGGQPANPPAPQVDLSGIQDTLKSLNEQIEGITEQLAGFEDEIAAIKTPAPKEPESKWKPKTWDDFVTMAEEKAQGVLAAAQEASLKKAEAEKKAAEEAQVKIDQEFDTTLATLEAAGKIPKVANAADPNDPGRVVRREIFGLGIAYNTPDLAAMAELRGQLAESGFRFDLESKKIVKAAAAGPSVPFGQIAPVGSSAKSTPSGEKPSYKEIHNLSMDEIVRRFNAGT